MTMPTDAECDEILNYYDKQTGSITSRVKKALGQWASEQGVIEKMNASAEDARKAWIVAQRLDAEQKKMKDAMLRSTAAQQSTLKANLE